MCAEKVNQAHSDMYEVCHQYQSMSIHALDRHLCLDVTHPANQTGAHLAEELQVKVPDARVELTSFEKVINHIPWREKRQRNEQIIFYSILFLQDNGQNKQTSQNTDGETPPPLTGVPSQCQLRRRGVARAHVQVDAEHSGDEEGGHGQLQEVAVDVGEVDTQVHRRGDRQTADHDGEESWREQMKRSHLMVAMNESL